MSRSDVKVRSAGRNHNHGAAAGCCLGDVKARSAGRNHNHRAGIGLGLGDGT
ncbi:MAG: hypothetical protein ABI330_05065 [Caldimonas sp.]